MLTNEKKETPKINNKTASKSQEENTKALTSEATNKSNEEWVTVKSRRKENVIIGTQKNKCTLTAAQRKAWLYVGRLHSETRTGDLQEYIRNQGINKSIECEELPTKGTNKAYKISIDIEELQTVQNPDFWPEGVLVRQFRFPFRR